MSASPSSRHSEPPAATPNCSERANAHVAGPIVREARFDGDDLAGIFAVLSRTLPVPYGACTFEDFTRAHGHMWLDNPARTPDHVFGWVLESPADGIVGFAGQIPLRVKIAEQEIVGTSGSAFGVLPAYRNYSLKLLLDRTVGDRPEKAHFSVATTANHVSSTLNAAMGMSQIPVKDFSQQLLWLLRPEVAVSWVISRTRWKVLNTLVRQFPVAYLLKGAVRFYFLRHRRLRFDCRRLPIEPVVSFTEEFNELWEDNKDDYDITTVRDRAFLNWRHCWNDSLVGRTFVFACRDHGKLVGYIALQARIPESGYLPGHYLVTDLFYKRTRTDVLHNLMNHAFDFSKGQGCSVFEVAGYSKEVIEQLKTQRPFIRRANSCPYWYRATGDFAEILREESRWWPSGTDGDSNL